MRKSKICFPVSKCFTLKYGTELWTSRWFDLPIALLVRAAWAVRWWVFIGEWSGVAMPSGSWLWLHWIMLIVIFWDGAGVNTSSSLAAPVVQSLRLWLKKKKKKSDKIGSWKEKVFCLVLSLSLQMIMQSRIKPLIWSNSIAMAVTNNWRRPNSLFSLCLWHLKAMGWVVSHIASSCQSWVIDGTGNKLWEH